jgi:hypothetical protein
MVLAVSIGDTTFDAEDDCRTFDTQRGDFTSNRQRGDLALDDGQEGLANLWRDDAG